MTTLVQMMRGPAVMASRQTDWPDPWVPAQCVLSIDVEEHFRIEAATGLALDPAMKSHYGGRLEPSTRWLLDQFAQRAIRATFFVVGEIARHHPRLVRAIHQLGHEVACHSWDHQRVHNLTPASFRADVQRSKDALEQVTGEAVVGYRAPTFSIVPQTAWAIDVLAELGMLYDSSVFPVFHDRYGVPRAPRVPFMAKGSQHTLLELPLATWRLLGINVPAAGGGYFRVFPRFVLEHALEQARRHRWPAVTVLYFHPWEFDRGQARLPLRLLSRLRTYAGIARSRARLRNLLAKYHFTPAFEVAKQLDNHYAELPCYSLATASR
jgi:polysaccharide deacetylase family protein (PEP-CTERM system associated)